MGFFKTNAGRWPGGTVPFAIHPGIAKFSGAVEAIQDAVNVWNATTTKINLVPKQAIHFFFIEFIPSTYVLGCDSKIGMQGGRQTIRCSFPTLAMGLWSGTVVHEIGHALGLKHEHQRPERNDFATLDEFVAFYVAGEKEGDFKQLGAPHYIPVGKYDVQSCMHYKTRVASIDEESYAYFKAKKPKLGGQSWFGTQGSPTPGDIQTINMMYP